MAFARQSAVAAPLPDGRVVVAGGTDGITARADVEVFSPASNSFLRMAHGMAAKRAYAAALPDGRVLIAGGTSN
jgi:hypothetical protein